MKRYRLFLNTPCWIWAGIVILGSVPSVMAQKVHSQVKLMLERLPLEKQQKLKDFAEYIESYINDYNWTDESSSRRNSEDRMPLIPNYCISNKKGRILSINQCTMHEFTL